MSAGRFAQLRRFAATRSAVDPAEHPDEVFDLLSIPAYDDGMPERTLGSKIGSIKLQVNPGDVLVSKIVPHIQRVWVVPDGKGPRQIASSEWIVVRSSDLAPGYLRYSLLSSNFHAQFLATVEGMSGSLQRARPKDALGIKLLIPKFDRQQQIADYLDRETTQIDALIAKQQRLILTLRERRKSHLLSLVTRGVDNTTDFKQSSLDWVEEVPAHWPELNIRRVAQMKTGHTPSRGKTDYWVNTTIPWFTLADIWQLRSEQKTYLGETASRISELGLANSAAELLPAGTVALSRTASVGFSGIMPVPMATSQDFWNWVCGPRLHPEYLMYTFRAMRGHLLSLMIGSTHKTIYQPIAAGIRIPLPPFDEQREIVASITHELSKIDTLIAKAERFIKLSKERRAALITAAVTGQIEVAAA